MTTPITTGSRLAILLAAASVVASAQLPTHFIRMEVVHGKPYVKVLVNGRGPFRFVVDTGTGGEALVTPELADLLALPRIGQARLIDPSGQGEQRADIVFLQSIRLAGIEFPAVKAIRHRLGGEDSTCQGLLGFTLFHNYLLTLDYPHQLLTLESGMLAPDGENSVLPFRMPNGVPIVPLHVGDQAFEAQFDSGGTGLSLPAPLVSRIKLASNPSVFGTGHSLATRYQVKSARLAEDVRLGRYTFSHPVVEINPAFPLANFGSGPIENFAVTFDQTKLLVRLESPHPKLHLDLTPTEIRMKNAPSLAPADLALVPVG